MDNKQITIYQGEPLTFFIADKAGEEYVADISSYTFEALLCSHMKQVVKSWSSQAQTILPQQIQIENKTCGIALFSMPGNETAQMEPRTYTLEVARVLPNGRAIKVLEGAINIKAAVIKEGI